MKWVLHQSNISWFKKMFLRTLALVFMFLVRLRFPSRLSLLQVIRNRYGDTIVKLVRKFEKVDFKHCKAALDLNFLQTCRSFNVIPKFLKFCVTSKNLWRSQAHQKCLNHLPRMILSRIFPDFRTYFLDFQIFMNLSDLQKGLG